MWLVFLRHPIMQLEAQLRLCQSCLWCCKTGLRLLSQSYAHRKAVNYYDLLGVKSDATLEEIKNAFFDKSKKLHPDSDPSNPMLHSQFVELNEAYRVLSKDLSRKEYDLKIKHPYSGSQAFRSTSSHASYRPRVNGFKKQTEILRQKHAEFLEKYKIQNGGENK
ncbi:hypothetical protein L3Q82_005713 [Scortum barcoo]|uniref:Uncharacterized protein n=1 Tax=Scortum barcoo TaxID=214431 RepID=A0ACB8V6R4_9TELE|nr:hypothetical protein L3Q82_005713 [Scortum barcoo]